MFKNISIIGDGAMGTALTRILFCEKKEQIPRCRMWGYDAKELSEMKKAGENVKFLPGYKVPAELEFESDDKATMAGADLLVSAVPCQFMRSVWGRLKRYVPAGVPIVSVAKGIENGTLLRPSEILLEVLGDERSVATLSGPTIADELARYLPAVACAASSDMKLARGIQESFSNSWFRVYTNNDIAGVELAGAIKNVIAIAAGIIDGIGAGDNAKAALLSRGLAEITRIGLVLGAKAETFAGLAGLGDLVTTCVSPSGRNRSFGERIGKGQSADDARNATESVIEGITTCESVVALARRFDVEMPITEAVYAVVFEGKPVGKAISDLMSRKLKSE